MAAARRVSLRAAVGVVARILLGGLLIYAGASKLLDVSKFAVDVANFKILPRPLGNMLAVTLPWQEVVVGAMLVVGIWTRTAALLALGFFTVFLIAISSAILRGLNIECGCMGHADAAPVGLKKLALDGGFIVLTLVVLFTTVQGKKQRRPS